MQSNMWVAFFGAFSCGLFFFTNATNDFSNRGCEASRNGKFLFANFVKLPFHHLDVNPIASSSLTSAMECAFACVGTVSCFSFNVEAQPDIDSLTLCELLPTDKYNASDKLKANSSYHHHSIHTPCLQNPCKNEGKCVPAYSSGDFRCTCSFGFYGKTCEKEMRGMPNNPGMSCFDIYSGGIKTNGVYHVKPDAQGDKFKVYCDMNAGGYTLVFKAVSGINENVLQTYSSNNTKNEDVEEVLNVNNSCKENYKNRIVSPENWKKTQPSLVRLVLYQGGVEKLVMKFNGTSSDLWNWFSLERLLESPYQDINAEIKNYFSITGDRQLSRYFFINRNYGNCAVDAGWVALTGNACGWEKAHQFQTALFSHGSRYARWDDSGLVSAADVLAIFVQ